MFFSLLLNGVIIKFLTKSINVVESSSIQENFTTKCFKDLGCFYTGPPWYHPQYRPNSVPPEDGIELQFLLYTQCNPDNSYDLKPTKESLQQSPFRANASTMVLIHGYLSKSSITEPIKDELLKVGDYNVINVDWNPYNQGQYEQVVANARVVASMVARLLGFLKDEVGSHPEKFHLIGHSLGGQIIGLIGQEVPGLGRITGLDPAGPYFYDAPAEIRLDPSDANFVDVIHANSGNDVYSGRGLYQILGHADFFPNGGNHQSGCDRDTYYKVAVVGEKFANACSHARVVTLFVHSIRDCQYTAYGCGSYTTFQDFGCNSTLRNRMGFHSTKPPDNYSLQYFLNTHSNPPYCEIKYKM